MDVGRSGLEVPAGVEPPTEKGEPPAPWFFQESLLDAIASLSHERLSALRHGSYRSSMC